MQIESSFVAVAFTSVIGLQGWILKEVVSLKVNVATITTEHNEMKKRINAVLTLAIIAPLLCLFSGCSSTGQALGKAMAVPGKILDKLADSVTATTTNIVTSTLSSGEQVNSTNITATLAPVVTRAENTAKTLADFLPAPYAQGAEVALAGATALLGLLVRRKQQTIDGHASTIADLSSDVMSANSQLSATIAGVEKAVAQSLPVKTTIAREAEKAGVAFALNQTVQSVVS